MANNFQLWEQKPANDGTNAILIRTQETKIYVATIEMGANKHKDAALIAAAPELLENLNNMLWNFEGKENLSEVQKAAVTYARQAVNKAITI